MLQRDIFLQGEGNAWLERNRDKLGQHDPVSELIQAQGIKPTAVLEIGCADGWRLEKLKAKFGCHAWGIDPAGAAGRMASGVGGVKGTADDLSCFSGYAFDLVIFGFCLYLCDPCDYFRIVAESDRALADGGHLIIHDFDVAFPWAAYRRPYRHKDGVYSHHFDFVRLWLAHPAYRMMRYKRDGEERASLLRKDMKGAFSDAHAQR
jgi:SAM-dependent methyltransferase